MIFILTTVQQKQFIRYVFSVIILQFIINAHPSGPFIFILFMYLLNVLRTKLQ